MIVRFSNGATKTFPSIRLQCKALLSSNFPTYEHAPCHSSQMYGCIECMDFLFDWHDECVWVNTPGNRQTEDLEDFEVPDFPPITHVSGPKLMICIIL